MQSGDVLKQLQESLGRAMSEVVIQMVQNLISEPRTIWCGHRSDLHVEISAPGWVEARQILDAYLEPRTALSDDVFAVESLRMLPDRSTDLHLVRSRPLVDTILKSMRVAGGASPRDARVDEAAPTPFAGVAFSRRGSREAVDAWIPVDAVKCVIEFVEQSRRLRDSEAATNGADGR